jgi:hypothetical protein
MKIYKNFPFSYTGSSSYSYTGIILLRFLYCSAVPSKITPTHYSARSAGYRYQISIKGQICRRTDMVLPTGTCCIICIVSYDNVNSEKNRYRS